MPYFGGASLADVLRQAWSDCSCPLLGSQLIAALRSVQAPAAGPVPGLPLSDATGQVEPAHKPSGSAQTPLDRISGLTYIQAAAWIVAQLAEGLHHAHQRGILHRDIKPSNVLLSAEGQPLLLDFNLAHDERADPLQATLGGTVAYMAPEHLRALLDPQLAETVDCRSEVYSLGMVLSEIITGRSPFEQRGSYSVLPVEIEAMAAERSHVTPSLRQLRPEVPWSLESIACTCLSPDPARRYQQAEHLADDLRRFLEDRPLRHAPEPSRVERVRKFFRGHPRLTAVAPIAITAVVLLLGVGAALAGTRAYLAQTQDRLGQASARERLQRHDAGVTRALCLVNTAIDMEANLRQGIVVCQETLGLFAPTAEYASPNRSEWTRLSPADRLRVAEDRRELLMLLAGATVRLAPEDHSVLRHALALIEEADSIPGLPASRALWEDRASYLSRLGETRSAEAAAHKAEQIPASTTRDHYLLATSYARRGTAAGFRAAISELDQALRQNPRHYWSLVQRGLCWLELGNDVAAAGDFGACIGLWPEFAWG
jgi:hypothetical protein